MRENQRGREKTKKEKEKRKERVKEKEREKNSWRKKREKERRNEKKKREEGEVAHGLAATTGNTGSLATARGGSRQWSAPGGGEGRSDVTPRSSGYGDVTATYICRSEIPSRIYAKHQYRQESKYGSTWCIIHSNILVQLQSYHQMWHNITWILHHR